MSAINQDNSLFSMGSTIGSDASTTPSSGSGGTNVQIVAGGNAGVVGAGGSPASGVQGSGGASGSGTDWEWWNQLPDRPLTPPSPGEMGLWTPEQVHGVSLTAISALPVSYFASTDSGWINNFLGQLTSEQVGALGPAQLTQLPATVIVLLPDAFIQALTLSQCGQLTITQVQSLSLAQIAILPSRAFSSPIFLSHLSSAQIGALGGGQLAQIPAMALAALPDAFIQALSTNQLGQLSSNQVRALNFTQVAVLPWAIFMNVNFLSYLSSEQIGHLSGSQLTEIPPLMFGNFPIAFIQALTTSQFDQLTANQISNLTLIQLAALPTTALFSANFLERLTHGQVASLSGSQLAQIPETVVPELETVFFQWLSVGQLGHLTSTQVQALTAAQIAALPTSDFASTDSGWINNFLGQLSIAQIAQLSGAQLAQIPTTVLSGLASWFVQSLTASQLGQLTGAQVQALTLVQIAALPTSDFASTDSGWINNFMGHLTSAQIAHLRAAQLAQMTTVAVAGLSGAFMHALTADQLRGAGAAFLAGLSAEQIGAINPVCLADEQAYQWLNTLTTAQKLGITAAQARQLRPLTVAHLLQADAQFAGHLAAGVALPTQSVQAVIDNLVEEGLLENAEIEAGITVELKAGARLENAIIRRGATLQMDGGQRGQAGATGEGHGAIAEGVLLFSEGGGALSLEYGNSPSAVLRGFIDGDNQLNIKDVLSGINFAELKSSRTGNTLTYTDADGAVVLTLQADSASGQLLIYKAGDAETPMRIQFDETAGSLDIRKLAVASDGAGGLRVQTLTRAHLIIKTDDSQATCEMIRQMQGEPGFRTIVLEYLPNANGQRTLAVASGQEQSLLAEVAGLLSADSTWRDQLNVDLVGQMSGYASTSVDDAKLGGLSAVQIATMLEGLNSFTLAGKAMRWAGQAGAYNLLASGGTGADFIPGSEDNAIAQREAMDQLITGVAVARADGKDAGTVEPLPLYGLLPAPETLNGGAARGGLEQWRIAQDTSSARCATLVQERAAALAEDATDGQTEPSVQASAATLAGDEPGGQTEPPAVWAHRQVIVLCEDDPTDLARAINLAAEHPNESAIVLWDGSQYRTLYGASALTAPPAGVDVQWQVVGHWQDGQAEGASGLPRQLGGLDATALAQSMANLGVELVKDLPAAFGKPDTVTLVAANQLNEGVSGLTGAIDGSSTQDSFAHDFATALNPLLSDPASLHSVNAIAAEQAADLLGTLQTNVVETTQTFDVDGGLTLHLAVDPQTYGIWDSIRARVRRGGTTPTQPTNPGETATFTNLNKLLHKEFVTRNQVGDIKNRGFSAYFNNPIGYLSFIDNLRNKSTVSTSTAFGVNGFLDYKNYYTVLSLADNEQLFIRHIIDNYINAKKMGGKVVIRVIDTNGHAKFVDPANGNTLNNADVISDIQHSGLPVQIIEDAGHGQPGLAFPDHKSFSGAAWADNVNSANEAIGFDVITPSRVIFQPCYSGSPDQNTGTPSFMEGYAARMAEHNPDKPIPAYLGTKYAAYGAGSGSFDSVAVPTGGEDVAGKQWKASSADRSMAMSNLLELRPVINSDGSYRFDTWRYFGPNNGTLFQGTVKFANTQSAHTTDEVALLAGLNSLATNYQAAVAAGSDSAWASDQDAFQVIEIRDHSPDTLQTLKDCLTGRMADTLVIDAKGNILYPPIDWRNNADFNAIAAARKQSGKLTDVSIIGTFADVTGTGGAKFGGASASELTSHIANGLLQPLTGGTAGEVRLVANRVLTNDYPSTFFRLPSAIPTSVLDRRTTTGIPAYLASMVQEAPGLVAAMQTTDPFYTQMPDSLFKGSAAQNIAGLYPANFTWTAQYDNGNLVFRNSSSLPEPVNTYSAQDVKFANKQRSMRLIFVLGNDEATLRAATSIYNKHPLMTKVVRIGGVSNAGTHLIFENLMGNPTVDFSNAQIEWVSHSEIDPVDNGFRLTAMAIANGAGPGKSANAKFDVRHFLDLREQALSYVNASAADMLDVDEKFVVCGDKAGYAEKLKDFLGNLVEAEYRDRSNGLPSRSSSGSNAMLSVDANGHFLYGAIAADGSVVWRYNPPAGQPYSRFKVTWDPSSGQVKVDDKALDPARAAEEVIDIRSLASTASSGVLGASDVPLGEVAALEGRVLAQAQAERAFMLAHVEVQVGEVSVGARILDAMGGRLVTADGLSLLDEANLTALLEAQHPETLSGEIAVGEVLKLDLTALDGYLLGSHDEAETLKYCEVLYALEEAAGGDLTKFITGTAAEIGATRVQGVMTQIKQAGDGEGFTPALAQVLETAALLARNAEQQTELQTRLGLAGLIGDDATLSARLAQFAEEYTGVSAKDFAAFREEEADLSLGDAIEAFALRRAGETIGENNPAARVVLDSLAWSATDAVEFLRQHGLINVGEDGKYRSVNALEIRALMASGNEANTLRLARAGMLLGEMEDAYFRGIHDDLAGALVGSEDEHTANLGHSLSSGSWKAYLPEGWGGLGSEASNLAFSAQQLYSLVTDWNSMSDPMRGLNVSSLVVNVAGMTPVTTGLTKLISSAADLGIGASRVAGAALGGVVAGAGSALSAAMLGVQWHDFWANGGEKGSLQYQKLVASTVTTTVFGAAGLALAGVSIAAAVSTAVAASVLGTIAASAGPIGVAIAAAGFVISGVVQGVLSLEHYGNIGVMDDYSVGENLKIFFDAWLGINSSLEKLLAAREQGQVHAKALLTQLKEQDLATNNYIAQLFAAQGYGEVIHNDGGAVSEVRHATVRYHEEDGHWNDYDNIYQQVSMRDRGLYREDLPGGGGKAIFTRLLTSSDLARLSMDAPDLHGESIGNFFDLSSGAAVRTVYAATDEDSFFVDKSAVIGGLQGLAHQVGDDGIANHNKEILTWNAGSVDVVIEQRTDGGLHAKTSEQDFVIKDIDNLTVTAQGNIVIHAEDGRQQILDGRTDAGHTVSLYGGHDVRSANGGVTAHSRTTFVLEDHTTAYSYANDLYVWREGAHARIIRQNEGEQGAVVMLPYNLAAFRFRRDGANLTLLGPNGGTLQIDGVWDAQGLVNKLHTLTLTDSEGSAVTLNLPDRLQTGVDFGAGDLNKVYMFGAGTKADARVIYGDMASNTYMFAEGSGDYVVDLKTTKLANLFLSTTLGAAGTGVRADDEPLSWSLDANGTLTLTQTRGGERLRVQIKNYPTVKSQMMLMVNSSVADDPDGGYRILQIPASGTVSSGVFTAADLFSASGTGSGGVLYETQLKLSGDGIHYVADVSDIAKPQHWVLSVGEVNALKVSIADANDILYMRRGDDLLIVDQKQLLNNGSNLGKTSYVRVTDYFAAPDKSGPLPGWQGFTLCVGSTGSTSNQMVTVEQVMAATQVYVASGEGTVYLNRNPANTGVGMGHYYTMVIGGDGKQTYVVDMNVAGEYTIQNIATADSLMDVLQLEHQTLGDLALSISGNDVILAGKVNANGQRAQVTLKDFLLSSDNRHLYLELGGIKYVLPVSGSGGTTTYFADAQADEHLVLQGNVANQVISFGRDAAHLHSFVMLNITLPRAWSEYTRTVIGFDLRLTDGDGKTIYLVDFYRYGNSWGVQFGHGGDGKWSQCENAEDVRTQEAGFSADDRTMLARYSAYILGKGADPALTQAQVTVLSKYLFWDTLSATQIATLQTNWDCRTGATRASVLNEEYQMFLRGVSDPVLLNRLCTTEYTPMDKIDAAALAVIQELQADGVEAAYIAKVVQAGLSASMAKLYYPYYQTGVIDGENGIVVRNVSDSTHPLTLFDRMATGLLTHEAMLGALESVSEATVIAALRCQGYGEDQAKALAPLIGRESDRIGFNTVGLAKDYLEAGYTASQIKGYLSQGINLHELRTAQSKDSGYFSGNRSGLITVTASSNLANTPTQQYSYRLLYDYTDGSGNLITAGSVIDDGALRQIYKKEKDGNPAVLVEDEVEHHDSSFTVDGKTYPAGDYIVLEKDHNGSDKVYILREDKGMSGLSYFGNSTPQNLVDGSGAVNDLSSWGWGLERSTTFEPMMALYRKLALDPGNWDVSASAKELIRAVAAMGAKVTDDDTYLTDHVLFTAFEKMLVSELKIYQMSDKDAKHEAGNRIRDLESILGVTEDDLKAGSLSHKLINNYQSFIDCFAASVGDNVRLRTVSSAGNSAWLQFDLNDKMNFSGLTLSTYRYDDSPNSRTAVSVQAKDASGQWVDLCASPTQLSNNKGGQSLTLNFEVGKTWDAVHGVPIFYDQYRLVLHGNPDDQYGLILDAALLLREVNFVNAASSGAMPEVTGFAAAVAHSGLPIASTIAGIVAGVGSTPVVQMCAGDTVTLTATVSTAVKAGGAFQALLSTGDWVTFTAASAGTTLTATYKIPAGLNEEALRVTRFTSGTVLSANNVAMSAESLPQASNNLPGATIYSRQPFFSLDGTTPDGLAHTVTRGGLSPDAVRNGVALLASPLPELSEADWAKVDQPRFIKITLDDPDAVLVDHANGDQTITASTVSIGQTAGAHQAVTVTISTDSAGRKTYIIAVGETRNAAAQVANMLGYQSAQAITGTVGLTMQLADQWGNLSPPQTEHLVVAGTDPRIVGLIGTTVVEHTWMPGAATSSKSFTLRIQLADTDALAGDVLNLRQPQDNAQLGLGDVLAAKTLTAADITNGYVDVVLSAQADGEHRYRADLTRANGQQVQTVYARSDSFELTIDSVAPTFQLETGDPATRSVSVTDANGRCALVPSAVLSDVSGTIGGFTITLTGPRTVTQQARLYTGSGTELQSNDDFAVERKVNADGSVSFVLTAKRLVSVATTQSFLRGLQAGNALKQGSLTVGISVSDACGNVSTSKTVNLTYPNPLPSTAGVWSNVFEQAEVRDAGTAVQRVLAAQVGQVLTPHAFTQDPNLPDANQLHYQWQRLTDQGSYENIAGAISLNYTPTVGDAGKQLRLQVSYTDLNQVSNVVHTQDFVHVYSNVPYNRVVSATITGAAGDDYFDLETIVHNNPDLTALRVVGGGGGDYVLAASERDSVHKIMPYVLSFASGNDDENTLSFTLERPDDGALTQSGVNLKQLWFGRISGSADLLVSVNKQDAANIPGGEDRPEGSTDEASSYLSVGVHSYRIENFFATADQFKTQAEYEQACHASLGTASETINHLLISDANGQQADLGMADIQRLIQNMASFTDQGTGDVRFSNGHSTLIPDSIWATTQNH